MQLKSAGQDSAITLLSGTSCNLDSGKQPILGRQRAERSGMVGRFRSVFAELSEGRSPKLTPYQLVTLASMIEKETGVGGERKLVASVFYNRLERRMLLQCDPTVIYGLMAEDRYNGRLTREELASPHVYNTYVHAGLPPGPIANPGSASLKAVFEPAETNYLYFVAQAGGGGGHVFSESLEAHNQAVGAYRRSR